MDDEDFLAAVEADNANLPVEEPKEEPAPLELTEEAPPVAETPAAEPAPEAVQVTTEAPVMVPIGVLHEVRDELRNVKADISRFQQAQQPQPEPQQAPDMFEDPDGFASYQDQKMQQQLYQANLRWSERVAAVEHGAETVSQAKEWGLARCDADPYFNAKVAASGDPVGFVVSEWKREQIASQVTPEELTQFQAWKAAHAAIQAPQPPGAAAPPNSSPTAPPRSLASAPSAGGVLTEVEQSDEEAFNEVIPKR